jgi:hypothetical protein
MHYLCSWKASLNIQLLSQPVKWRTCFLCCQVANTLLRLSSYELMTEYFGLNKITLTCCVWWLLSKDIKRQYDRDGARRISFNCVGRWKVKARLFCVMETTAYG